MHRKGNLETRLEVDAYWKPSPRLRRTGVKTVDMVLRDAKRTPCSPSDPEMIKGEFHTELRKGIARLRVR